MSRYSRQTLLPEVGAAGQARIGAAHVLVVGAGGLGVPVVQYLAGAGIGRITLVDPDRVEKTNLHRQPIYGPHLGEPKAEAAAAFVRGLNPQVTVTPRVEWLTPANMPDLMAGADLVLDCADSFAVSYTLSDTCLPAGKPLISASVLGLAGYVGGFCGGAPSLRAVFPDLPDSLATCATAGVLGPVVGMFGTLQAQMALAVLVGLAPSPLGLLVRHDMAGFRSSSFRFDDAPEPDAAPHRFVARADLQRGDFVVELRGAEEAPVPAAPHAQRLPVEAFGPGGPAPAPGQRAVFACRTGLRAWRAADRLRPHWPGEIALLADTPNPLKDPRR
ncbi:HesA/MoeB/ThiF family protein [Frigidibacter mobilis]|uniref:UBA/ThiF-type NAD/FAD-binding protein n=1 Tax=Frigidibacter mobilis TaxID=1335048 RepID=A0A165SN80_9RHOB|nr:HesA/MoeB/ThiF family protein [Frigidibacter mobilis]AMY69589.1 UBA/ThiF-type NAD/FAD-binding protein [Frigidibacter mobilis]